MTAYSFYATAILCTAMAISACQHEPVDFNAEIRPILNQNCLACHGGVKRSGGLSLRFSADAYAGGESGRPAIVPGKPGQSELYKRIVQEDPELLMPQEGHRLSRDETDLIKKWIRQGAAWESHWAYIAPKRKTVKPRQVDKDHHIDGFVYKALERTGLSPGPSADPATLARRISLDLTGMPLGLDRARAFTSDPTEKAYEILVDELLASPHFGERWASLWLDLARYADSQGYQKDLLRPNMWRYRDWVIHAFNRDMPFDSFTIAQLAGDLLPHPSNDDLLATAFHRNTMTNDEGGTDDEEFRVSAVLDRVNTTFEVWQGATIGCVQCHDHPYDPFQHQSYYQLMAFFNTTADADLTSDVPVLPLLSPAQKAEARALQEKLNAMEVEEEASSPAYRDALRRFARIQPGKVPVMQELQADTTRITHIFERGNWLAHGAVVTPDVPDFLPSLDAEGHPDRLDLAQWLIGENNPLTARVMVNRIWEQLFGTGLVVTVEDFGTQGSPPSNLELLDHLAVCFQYDFNWSLKRLLQYIVTSKTYRQSSHADPEDYLRDPDNIFLARGPRLRLSAEQIRDQGLTASGLLNPTVYGPSVMPYQPEGVWNVIRHTSRWENSTGSDAHRRALYTFWRRVSPYPSMELFDVPSREFCVSRRIRTNTPVQALVSLNDPVYTEMARALAKRMITEGGNSVRSQISYGYECLLFKPPGYEKMAYLEHLFENGLASYVRYDSHEKQAYQNAREFAFFQVANVLLSLDEVLVKA